MDMVSSRNGALCKKLYEIYQLRGVKEKCSLKPLDELRNLLGLEVDEDLDVNEFIHKLFGKILNDEDNTRQLFSGKRKERTTLDSSMSGDVSLERVEKECDGDEDAVHSLGLPVLPSTADDVNLRDLLSRKLNEASSIVPYSEWIEEWKSKYEEGGDTQCRKMVYFDVVPKVAVLGLERGTKTTEKKDNQPVQIPNSIPEADFTHPEDEGIHSINDEGEGSLFLFGMIVHSAVRNHHYSMVRLRDSSWIVHDDLSTYECTLTDDLLKNLGGKDRKDSSITFVYIKDSELIVEKPPLPAKTEQKDILQRLGSSRYAKNSADLVVIDDDDREVDYQKIFHDMEASTRSFVGLDPLKQQFLRFAKTAILNQKRKRLGFQVEDMNMCLHFIFQGNPGTGKTTFARKVADLLYSVKKIKKRKVVEVQRGDLVGQYLGSTEEKTAGKIREAKGGVLFIDEAYRLIPRSTSVDYGRIAINQLMAAMEKGDPVMIFAGYPTEMKEFLKANPGLSSRIKYKFTFPDYSVQEMATILENGIRESGYRYSGDSSSLVEIIEKETTKNLRSQQNGRLAKNILGEAIIYLSNRLTFEDEDERLVTLNDDDVIQACRTLSEPIEPADEDKNASVSDTAEKS
ncbi:uncharacterized protein LOC144651469 isoform X1 [Oculina patagonica]